MQGGDAPATLEHAAVDVTQLERSIRGKLEDSDDGGRRRRNRATIFRVIPHIRGRDGHEFNPRVISIGPFHKDKKGLRAMEKVKWEYLRDLLARHPRTNLHGSIARVSVQVKDLRDQYSEELKAMKDDDFVLTMFLDGCFILEFMFKLDDESKGRGGDSVVASLPGGIFTSAFLLDDLLLFENQIPFRVLETLYEDVKGNLPDTLPELARRTIMPLQETLPPLQPEQETSTPPPQPQQETLPPPQQQETSPPPQQETSPSPQQETLPPPPPQEITPPRKIFHLLHLYHDSQVPQYCPSETTESSLSRWQVVYRGLGTINRKIFDDAVSQVPFLRSCLVMLCSWLVCCSSKVRPVPWLIRNATKLKEAGVRFKWKEFTKGEPTSFLTVTFSDDGIFEIPHVVVDGGFISQLRNLIAFEQSCPSHVEGYFTSYCYLMSCLIDTDSDVGILEDEGILSFVGGRPDQAADFFDEATSGTTLQVEKHYYFKQLKNVNSYCESHRHGWRARLMRDYFGNPWTIISVIAAAVLLALTVVQTFYAPYAYYHPRQP